MSKDAPTERMIGDAKVSKAGDDVVTVEVKSKVGDDLERHLTEALETPELDGISGEVDVEDVTGPDAEGNYNLKGKLTVDDASDQQEAFEIVKDTLAELEYQVSGSQ